jgi:hypothetical protein
MGGGAPVSFQADIAPIWKRSCAGMFCHASPDDAETPADFLEDWIDVDGALTSDMRLIAPGDPEASFLIHKLAGDQACYGLACTVAECGASMPPGEALSAADQALFHGWIAQGAPE